MKNQTKPKITRKQQCVIYTRVSTDLQAEVEFNSCEAQELKIKSYIDSQDKFTYKASYSDEGFSGGNLNRPNLQQLLEDVKSKRFNTILVYKLDRLTRSLKDFYNLIEYLDSYNVSFISITESFDTSTPAGRLFLNMMLTFAQYEREIAGERVKDKLLERAKKGMWKGGHTPFGYKNIDKKLLIDEEQSKIVKLIFETYVKTGSLASAWEIVQSKTITDQAGRVFTKKFVFDLLRKPVYTGKIKHNNVIYDGVHNGIISEHLFNLAQNIHKDKTKKHKFYYDHLLAGLVHCKECDYKMTPHFTNKVYKGKLKRYFYYRCITTLKKSWDSCSIKQVNSNKLQSFIVENLNRLVKDDSYIENLVFRLNSDLLSPHHQGFALSNPELSSSHFGEIFSVFGIQNSLNLALTSIKKNTCTQRKKALGENISNYIQNINYSHDKIDIKFTYHFNQNETLKNKQEIASNAPKMLLNQLNLKNKGMNHNQNEIQNRGINTISNQDDLKQKEIVINKQTPLKHKDIIPAGQFVTEQNTDINNSNLNLLVLSVPNTIK